MRTLCRKLPVGCALVFVCLCLAVRTSAQLSLAVPNRVVQTPDNSSRVTLKGNVHPPARSEFSNGPVSDALPINRILLLLKRSQAQEAALQSLLEAQQDKSSPTYHQATRKICLQHRRRFHRPSPVRSAFKSRVGPAPMDTFSTQRSAYSRGGYCRWLQRHDWPAKLQVLLPFREPARVFSGICNSIVTVMSGAWESNLCACNAVEYACASLAAAPLGESGQVEKHLGENQDDRVPA
jgi:hypothetical protein